MGRLDEALREYEAAVRDFPENAVARTGRAEVLKAMGRLDEALREYEAAVRDFPENAVARTGRAEVLKAMGRLDEALREYEAAVRDFPENVVARTGRAEVLKAMGRLDEALREYEAAVRDFPENVVARTGRAEVLKAMGRLDEALREYEAAVRDFPENVVGRSGRAEVLKAMGRLDEALREYEAVVRDFPNDVTARNGRAEVLRAMGRLDEALREYEAAVRDFPENVVARTGRAEVLKAMGRLDEALREYDRALALFPHDQYARTGKTVALVLLSRYDEALEFLAQTPPRTLDDWIACHIRGMIELKRGNVASAITIFERGIRESPWQVTWPYFRAALAVARLRRGRSFRLRQRYWETSTGRSSRRCAFMLLAPWDWWSRLGRRLTGSAITVPRPWKPCETNWWYGISREDLVDRPARTPGSLTESASWSWPLDAIGVRCAVPGVLDLQAISPANPAPRRAYFSSGGRPLIPIQTVRHGENAGNNPSPGAPYSPSALAVTWMRPRLTFA